MFMTFKKMERKPFLMLELDGKPAAIGKKTVDKSRKYNKI